MEPLIRVEGVSKYYPRVHRPGERLRAFAALLAGREPREGAEVLHDVSLEIFRGQSFGIIGENGAGKSTLLKILTGVISPSSGHVSVNGRVAALLELIPRRNRVGEEDPEEQGQTGDGEQGQVNSSAGSATLRRAGGRASFNAPRPVNGPTRTRCHVSDPSTDTVWMLLSRPSSASRALSRSASSWMSFSATALASRTSMKPSAVMPMAPLL